MIEISAYGVIGDFCIYQIPSSASMGRIGRRAVWKNNLSTSRPIGADTVPGQNFICRLIPNPDEAVIAAPATGLVRDMPERPQRCR